MPAPVLQFRRGNAGVAGTVPALRPGEPAISLNNFDFFIGIDTSVANNKFFGSHRYWGREDGTRSLRLKLVDRTGNSGTIELKAPDSHTGLTTYTFPSTPVSGNFLKVDANGGLSWDTIAVSGSFSDPTFNGIITINGGIASNLVPNQDNTYDVGISTLRWRNAHFSGIGTFGTGAVIDGVQIGITGANVINTGSGNLTLDSTGGLTTIDDNLTITGITTVGTGVGITQFSGSVSTGTSTSSVPTSKAVIDYVASQIGTSDDNLNISGNTGSGTIDLDTQSLTVSGPSNQVTTNASGQTITVSLVNDVVVGSSLSVPTIKVATIQHSNGTQAATIDSLGKITTSSDVTVSGNLYINGSTTQVNTTELTVYDRTITLGVTTAGTTPSTTSWDLGILMNYGDAGTAKTAGVIWKYGNNDVERFQFALNANNPGSGGDINAPDITVTTFAPIEVSSLWINGCGSLGPLEVIKCDTTQILLQDITIDAGTF